MVQCLYRETVNGRLVRMYKVCIEHCKDGNFENIDLKNVSIVLINYVLFLICYKGSCGDRKPYRDHFPPGDDGYPPSYTA